MPRAGEDPTAGGVVPRDLSRARIGRAFDHNALGLDCPLKLVRHEHHERLGFLSAHSNAWRKWPPTSALNCASAMTRTGKRTW